MNVSIRKESYSYRFVVISVIYVTALMLANTVASKLVLIGPFVITGGIVIFPLTYIFGDILMEVMGTESRDASYGLVSYHSSSWLLAIWLCRHYYIRHFG